MSNKPWCKSIFIIPLIIDVVEYLSKIPRYANLSSFANLDKAIWSNFKEKALTTQNSLLF